MGGGALFLLAPAPLTPHTQGSLSLASTAALTVADNSWDFSVGTVNQTAHIKRGYKPLWGFSGSMGT